MSVLTLFHTYIRSIESVEIFRITNAEKKCSLLGERGDREYKCCAPLAFADANQTIPGRVSGYPLRTSAVIDNAQLLQTSLKGVANEANDFVVRYEINLGTTPMRGAVWVDVSLASETCLDVQVDPPRVALYDNSAISNVCIIVFGIESMANNELVMFTHEIISCGTDRHKPTSHTMLYI